MVGGFGSMGLEKVSLGWMRHNAGLATSNAELDRLLEKLKVIPPKIYNGPPPPVIPRPVVVNIVARKKR